MRALLPLFLAAVSLARPALADQSAPVAADEVLGAPLPDGELARATGKFILPGGVSLALSVTSDTIVDGAAVLRTVFTVDQGARLQVFGRDGAASVQVAQAAAGSATGGATMVPNGVNVLFDRQSGTRTVSPTFTVGANAVGVGAARIASASDAATAGLTPLALTTGGPAIRTPDGLVMLNATSGGAQVTLAGDRFGVAHLVGRSVATAITNSANDRVFDTVSTIDIDLRDVSPFTMGTAAMRVDDMALDATRGMVR